MSHRKLRRRDFLTGSASGLLGAMAAPLGFQALRQRPSPDIAATLERQIPEWLQQAKVPGLGIAVIENAAIAWRRGFGVKDATAPAITVDNDTMFEAASMSKPVFAYTVMKLCETGVMDLDTPLTKYLAERFLQGDPRLDLMTARHVLSHTGGFQNWRSDASPLAIHFTPGAKYMYSGEGYNYLQTAVTRLLGEPFDSYMAKRLLDPFGMTSSRYVWNAEAERRMSRPHDAEGRALERSRSNESDVARYGAAGALLSTAGDYAKFLIEVMAPKPADAFRLTPTGVREMLRPHVKLESGDGPSSWALGWKILHGPNGDLISHGGDNRGFHCIAVASVERKSGFVAMTNGDNGPSVLRRLFTSDAMQALLAG